MAGSIAFDPKITICGNEGLGRERELSEEAGDGSNGRNGEKWGEMGRNV